MECLSELQVKNRKFLALEKALVDLGGSNLEHLNTIYQVKHLDLLLLLRRLFFVWQQERTILLVVNYMQRTSF